GEGSGDEAEDDPTDDSHECSLSVPGGTFSVRNRPVSLEYPEVASAHHPNRRSVSCLFPLVNYAPGPGRGPARRKPELRAGRGSSQVGAGSVRQWATGFSAPMPVRERTSISDCLTGSSRRRSVMEPMKPRRKEAGIETMPGFCSGNHAKSAV